MKLLSLSIPVELSSGRESINATLLDGNVSTPLSITDDHPAWSKARKLVETFQNQEITADELAVALVDAVDLRTAVLDKFIKVGGILDGRMAINGSHVTVDYEPVDPVLETHILRLLESDGTPKDERNWRAFARFIENLYANTSDFVRAQLFGWMAFENLHGHGLTLTEDGCFIGYKGVTGTTEAPLSINRGKAIVNGVQHNGQIPNPKGAIVEMPRNSVQADPAIGCGPGLHVGTYRYAQGWSHGVLLTVKVNPRDVVSVPTDCDAQKIRTCRYEVIDVVKDAYKTTTHYDSVDVPEPVSVEIAEALEKAVETGATVTISYTDKKGNTSTRSARVDELDGGHAHIEDLTNGGPRSFLVNRITAVEFDEVEEDYDAADETAFDARVEIEDIIAEAVKAKATILIEYVDQRGNSSTRVISPYGLTGHVPSVRAYCHESEGVRTFTLEGIRAASTQVELKAEPLADVETPASSDLDVDNIVEEYLNAAIAANADLLITYVDQKGRSTKRVVTPDSVNSKAGTLRAYCHPSEDFRTFLLSGLNTIEFATDELDPEVEEEIARNGYDDSAPWA